MPRVAVLFLKGQATLTYSFSPKACKVILKSRYLEVSAETRWDTECCSLECIGRLMTAGRGSMVSACPGKAEIASITIKRNIPFAQKVSTCIEVGCIFCRVC